MKLLVATDAHIYDTGDGNYWCKSIYGYEFWQRYLEVFEEVRIVARVKEVREDDCNAKLLVNGTGIEVFHVPFYQGPRQLAQKYFSILRALKNVDEGCDVALFRMPSQTAQMVYNSLKNGIPVAGEIVYDLTNDLENTNQNFLYRQLSRIQSNNLKKFCLNANGVSYVTEKTIQDHYPSYARIYGVSRDRFEASYSTITLNEDAFIGPRDYTNKEEFTLALSSVSMNSGRKGEKTLISIVKDLRDKGCKVNALLIGDGTLRHSFEEYAKLLGIENSVHFTGRLPSSKEVRLALTSADIFVFPTHGEGLPRGVLEAMAIGLPVLSTPVGGIPEIIDKEYLFNPTDIEAFSKKIYYLINNVDELNTMSQVNYNRVQKYRNSYLQKKRNDFYKKLRELAE